MGTGARLMVIGVFGLFVWVLITFVAPIIGLKVSMPSFGGGGTDSAVATSDYGPAILAEARKYDKESYRWAGGHPPASYSGGGLDCSGLIDVAVLKATGVNENRTADSFRNSPHWKAIPFEQATTGDIVYRLTQTHGGKVDHVAIVVANGGPAALTIFEASSPDGPVANQIRESANRKYSEFTAALRFHK